MPSLLWSCSLRCWHCLELFDTEMIFLPLFVIYFALKAVSPFCIKAGSGKINSFSGRQLSLPDRARIQPRVKFSHGHTSSSRMQVGEQAAQFEFSAQKWKDWAGFGVAVSGLLSAEYYVWGAARGPQLGRQFVSMINQLCGDNSIATFSVIFMIFVLCHSGMAALRPSAVKVLGERVWRYAFAGFSLPLAFISILYFIEHRYDGGVMWDLHGSPIAHALLWCTSLMSFFFLYPSTFNLLEVAAVHKPDLHLWDSGIARISRHPQMVGQLLWCAAHTAYIGSPFTCTVSALLCAYHAFGAWHGDQRLRARFGKDADAYFKRTSVVPFAAIVEGRQKLPRDYYREFVQLPYFTVAAGALLAYHFHPQMIAAVATLGW